MSNNVTEDAEVTYIADSSLVLNADDADKSVARIDVDDHLVGKTFVEDCGCSNKNNDIGDDADDDNDDDDDNNSQR